MLIPALAYLRCLVAGVCATVWRTIVNRECPCEFCRAHRRFTHQGGGRLR